LKAALELDVWLSSCAEPPGPVMMNASWIPLSLDAGEGSAAPSGVRVPWLSWAEGAQSMATP
jgi:hypothetical protein